MTDQPVLSCHSGKTPPEGRHHGLGPDSSERCLLQGLPALGRHRPGLMSTGWTLKVLRTRDLSQSPGPGRKGGLTCLCETSTHYVGIGLEPELFWARGPWGTGRGTPHPGAPPARTRVPRQAQAQALRPARSCRRQGSDSAGSAQPETLRPPRCPFKHLSSGTLRGTLGRPASPEHRAPTLRNNHHLCLNPHSDRA